MLLQLSELFPKTRHAKGFIPYLGIFCTMLTEFTIWAACCLSLYVSSWFSLCWLSLQRWTLAEIFFLYSPVYLLQIHVTQQVRVLVFLVSNIGFSNVLCFLRHLSQSFDYLGLN